MADILDFLSSDCEDCSTESEEEILKNKEKSAPTLVKKTILPSADAALSMATTFKIKSEDLEELAKVDAKTFNLKRKIAEDEEDEKLPLRNDSIVMPSPKNPVTEKNATKKATIIAKYTEKVSDSGRVRGPKRKLESKVEKTNAKDKVKRQRTRGQTGLNTREWKSDLEMVLRQGYD